MMIVYGIVPVEIHISESGKAKTYVFPADLSGVSSSDESLDDIDIYQIVDETNWDHAESWKVV